jgi:hypothetical protein
MAKRSIEETFRAITPRNRRGIPEPPAISAGFSSGSASGGATGGTADLATSLSQAGQQITQLQSAYQQQAALITANTQAIQGNTSAQGSRGGSSVGQVASTFLGGALGFLSPVISGIASLFGGGSGTPAAVPIYTPPPSIGISGALSPVAPIYTPPAAPAATTVGQGPNTGPSSQAASSPITVNISAMDSQSFLDHSNDIANAVREAMLNMHPINNTIANL